MEIIELHNKVKCPICGTIIEIEAGDIKHISNDKGNSRDVVYCPVCRGEIRICKDNFVNE